jgi:hypothetical protein
MEDCVLQQKGQGAAVLVRGFLQWSCYLFIYDGGFLVTKCELSDISFLKIWKILCLDIL